MSGNPVQLPPALWSNSRLVRLPTTELSGQVRIVSFLL
jgi:hypothetical protein